MDTMTVTPAVPAVNAEEIAVESKSVETVVLHDNSNAAAISTQGVISTYSAIEQLVIEREVWENNACRTSNDQLYALLGRCYAHYKAMESGTKEATSLREGLNTYISLKGYKFSCSTHTLNKIVQCVFGQDRRRVSAYGIVLRTALANGVGVMDLPNYIREQGGVEEVRLAKSPNAMTAKQRAQVASSAVELKDLGTVTSASLSTKLDAGNVGKNTVLIGTWLAGGSIVVRAVVGSETALNAALAAHYSAVKADVAKADTENAERRAKEEAQKAIDDAANMATITL